MASKETRKPAQLDLWNGNEDFPWDDFRVAREYARSLKLGGRDEWDSLAEKGNPGGKGIPEDPEKVYRNRGWRDWNDWLGIKPEVKKAGPRQEGLFPGELTGKEEQDGDLWSGGQDSIWMNFHEAREIARRYGFEYEEEWEMFTAGKFPGREPLPGEIPENPDRIYRFVGWKGWKDWLIEPERQVEYTPFKEAREFVRSCRIEGKESWRDFLKGTADRCEEYGMVLPVRPHLEYRDSGWISWEDWLGMDIRYRDFKTTRKFVHSLKLKSRKEWRNWCSGRMSHKPVIKDNIFRYPELAYHGEGWNGWGDWLG